MASKGTERGLDARLTPDCQAKLCVTQRGIHHARSGRVGMPKPYE
jgi:hypothetical protein